MPIKKEIATGQPFSLAGSIGYQKGAVVSKTIVMKDAGTVTLFSFDKGEGLSEHTAPYDALVIILDGRAEVRISGKAHLLQAGDAIAMPADKPHALKAVERFKMMLVMVKA
ncbi:MAG: cupin domain-containing protein [Euryarchaeota archaeon]|nr:cupin domain-containing protein [Euryarchaeota archaeon]